MELKKLVASLLLCAGLLIAMPAFADIVIGLPPDPGQGNCVPFGCARNTEYQQVYSHTQFPGPITILDLEFFNTQQNLGTNQMNSGNWAISLSTTSADWNTISANYASNIGPDNTLVFSGNLAQPWAFPRTLHIALTTPFTYDPSKGNLLLDVVSTNTTGEGGEISFDVNFSNSYMTRVFDNSVWEGYGLVTGFSTIPEPGTLMLFGTGIVGVAGVIRRKRIF